MKDVYLLIGGNIGDRLGNLLKARNSIELRLGKIFKSSSVYETAAWGKTEQPSFLNQILNIKTSLSAESLMKSILEIEKEMGRIRLEKYAERVIDIDILYYENELIDNEFLNIPHPKIKERKFVLVPLNEICEEKFDIRTQKTVRMMFEECNDQLNVIKFPLPVEKKND